MQKIEFLAKEDKKISEALLDYGFSYNSINKMLRNKDVRIDGVKISADTNVYKGQNITVFCVELPKEKFEIVYEDENIIVVNKFTGIEVEGSDGLEGKIPGAIAVHRLDRNTEGLLVMAKDAKSEEILSRAIKKTNV